MPLRGDALLAEEPRAYLRFTQGRRMFAMRSPRPLGSLERR
jgi:hypothetical protein